MAVNQIKAGALLNYVILGLNALVGLVYTPYMLRMMGQSEYGIYSLAASVIAYLSIMDLGFGNAVIRYTAKFRAEGRIEEQYSMFGMCTVLYSIIGLLTLILGGVLCCNVDTLFGSTLIPEEIDRTRIVAILMVINLAVTFPLSIYGAIITAYEDFVFLRVIQIIRILLNTVTMICLLYFGYKAVAMVVVHSVFNISTLLLNVFYCKNRIRIKVRFDNFNRSLFSEIAVYSFWIFLNAIMDRIYWGTGQFVLGAVSGTAAVAVFAVAIQMQQMFYMFSTSISGVFLPRITAMVSNDCDSKTLSDLFIRTGRIQYVILALILSGFIVFGKSFVELWAGVSYSDAYYMALMIFIVTLIPLIQNIGITILQARNQMKFRSALYFILSICSLGLQIPFAKNWGGIGCTIAICIAVLLGQGLIMNIYYHKWQGLDIIRFWSEILKMSIAPAILTCITLSFKEYILDTNWSILFLSGVTFGILYVIVSWKFSMNQGERDLFLKPIIKCIKR